MNSRAVTPPSTEVIRPLPEISATPRPDYRHLLLLPIYVELGYIYALGAAESWRSKIYALLMLFVYPALFVVSFKVTTVVAGAGRGAPQWWYFSMAVLVIGLIYVGIVHVSTSGKFRVVYSTARGAAIMIANAKADGWHMEQFYKSYPWIKSEKRKTSTRDLWTITARAIEHAADHHGVTVRAIAMNERVSLLYIDKFPRLTVASPSTWGERMAVRFGRVLLMSEPQTCEHPRCEWPRTAVLPIESEEA